MYRHFAQKASGNDPFLGRRGFTKLAFCSHCSFPAFPSFYLFFSRLTVCPTSTQAVSEIPAITFDLCLYSLPLIIISPTGKVFNPFCTSFLLESLTQFYLDRKL